MRRSKRQHDSEFKAKVALAALNGKYSVKEIAAHFDIHPSLVHAWRQALVESAGSLFSHREKDAGQEVSMRSLERMLGELKAEQEWMRRTVSALGLHEKRACVSPEDSDLSILTQTRLLGLHRSGFYYQKRQQDAGIEKHENTAPEPADAAPADAALSEASPAPVPAFPLESR